VREVPRAVKAVTSRGGGDRGAGGVQEAGEEGGGGGRKRENYATLCNISQLQKCKEAGANKYRVGTRIKVNRIKREL